MHFPLRLQLVEKAQRPQVGWLYARHLLSQNQQPGVMHTQALADGYWVVLQQADQKFDYRASEDGCFLYCGGTVPEEWPSEPA